MAKVKIGLIEVEAPTVKSVITLLDKAVQYLKILETPATAMMNCPACGSYDLEPISPTVNHCRVCNTDIEYIGEEF